MSRLPEFQQYQLAFTARIRAPRGTPRPSNVPARRMKVYEELVFNNLQGFLLACYPVLSKVLGKKRWTTLVRQFLQEYRCHTPLFRQIAEEFLNYLRKHRTPQPDDPPFLLELAHYEWIELALAISEKEIDPAHIDLNGDLLLGTPALNPAMARLSYSFPVHRISPRFKPVEPDAQPTLIAAFRAADFEVRFVTLNPASMRLLEILEMQHICGKDALLQIAAEMQHPDPEQVVQGGRKILHNLQQEGAILGTWLHP